jgi:hypothetical protein
MWSSSPCQHAASRIVWFSSSHKCRLIVGASQVFQDGDRSRQIPPPVQESAKPVVNVTHPSQTTKEPSPHRMTKPNDDLEQLATRTYRHTCGWW